jgi:hypothetical protein
MRKHRVDALGKSERIAEVAAIKGCSITDWHGGQGEKTGGRTCEEIHQGGDGQDAQVEPANEPLLGEQILLRLYRSPRQLHRVLFITDMLVVVVERHADVVLTGQEWDREGDAVFTGQDGHRVSDAGGTAGDVGGIIRRPGR